MKNDAEIVTAFRKKDIRALSRLISRAENRDVSLYPILAELYETTGNAQVMGFTGPPGAGKSSLINQLVKRARDQKKQVAVLAVDPVSPFTGGALLGDRIRLNDHFNDPGVYIRSLSTRGKLGGLSLASREVIHLADAFGFDRVFVETVGVGQSEVDIRRIAPTTVVVLTPESGDGIQTLKAGVLEIGDLFVVNKSDREGAAKMVSELKTMIEMANRPQTPILSTSLNDTGSIDQLYQTIETHFTTSKAEHATKRKSEAAQTLLELLQAYIEAEAKTWVKSHAEATKNPYEAILKFAQKYPAGTLLPS
jgi:LAO/AO transport system kinase